MKILVERYAYKPEVLQDKLPSDWLLPMKDGRIMLNKVGYYHSPNSSELFLIVPKVFETTPDHFDNIPLEKLAQDSVLTIFKQYGRSHTEIEYIYRFALSLYLSLREFQKRVNDTTIVRQDFVQNILSTLSDNETSELDCVLSLVQFYRDNRDLIIFKVKQIQSQHFKKTDWRKTVRKITPILIDSGKTPIYIETIQKQREPDNEEELFTIFFSLMHYFHKEYGLNTKFDLGGLVLLDKIEDPSVQRRLVKRLKALKNQYFTDRLKRLLILMLQYFEKKETARTQQGKPEYVICQDYHLVFEDMIDKLLSDEVYERKLKEQSDGKIVDHIFKSESLFSPDNIWYIGDSKYYKQTTSLSENAIYKQHTYAKNVIQYNINLFNAQESETYLRYRDELTEGYNITPNFFIQAFIHPHDFTKSKADFKFKEEGTYLNRHFFNRVFDRDSLSVHTFDINFMFVFQNYIHSNYAILNDFKKIARDNIHTEVKKFYQSHFDFYELEIIGEVTLFIEKFFKLLNGKIFRRSDMRDTSFLILGLEKNLQYEEENNKILTLIAQECHFKSFLLT
jgi:hypothetical protein